METLRKVFLYFGAIVIGTILAHIAYGVEYREPLDRFASRPSLFNFLFAIVGAYLAWHMKERFVRLAWMIFSARYAIVTTLSWIALQMPVGVSLIFSSAFAILLTVSGAKDASRRTLFLVAAVLLAAFAFSYGARYHVDALLGRHSVMH